MSAVWICAEMASTHDAIFDRMLDGIAIAKQAGADAFKTAWGSSGDRIAERMHAPELAAMYTRLFAWPAEWLPLLAKEAHGCGLELLVTVDCPEDIAAVAPHVDRFKIASWGALDDQFIQEHMTYLKPFIISTGACSDDDADRLASLYDPEAILHCVSGYPAPLEEINLSVLRRWWCDGFSDHTANPLTGALAVAAGARILEVHFRHHETSPDNPDYAASLTPGGLQSYVYLAREAAKALGDGVKRVMPSEEKNVRFRYV